MGEEITRSVIERGDLAHLALFLWAVTATGLALVLVRELACSNRRFSDFVEEIGRLNRHLAGYAATRVPTGAGPDLGQNVKSFGQLASIGAQPVQDKGENTD